MFNEDFPRGKAPPGVLSNTEKGVKSKGKIKKIPLDELRSQGITEEDLEFGGKKKDHKLENLFVS